MLEHGLENFQRIWGFFSKLCETARFFKTLERKPGKPWENSHENRGAFSKVKISLPVRCPVLRIKPYMSQRPCPEKASGCGPPSLICGPPFLSCGPSSNLCGPPPKLYKPAHTPHFDYTCAKIVGQRGKALLYNFIKITNRGTASVGKDSLPRQRVQ